MTRADFAELLAQKTGAFPVGMLTRTEPKVRKTGNPNPEVVRITRRSAFLGSSYESVNNNALERAGEARSFEAGPLPWGVAVNRFILTHKGKTYLRYFSLHTGCHGEDAWMTPDGTPLEFSEVAPFLPESKPSNDQGIVWRTIALENVMEITMDGQTVVLAG